MQKHKSPLLIAGGFRGAKRDCKTHRGHCTRHHRPAGLRWRAAGAHPTQTCGACVTPDPPDPPGTASQQRDETARTRNMLNPSYGQKGGCNGYMDNQRLPTYPMRPPHLPTAACYVLTDSPPNSHFEIIPLIPNSPTSQGDAVPLLPAACSRWMVGGWCAGQSVPLPGSMCQVVLCPWFVLAGRSRGMEPAGPSGQQ